MFFFLYEKEILIQYVRAALVLGIGNILSIVHREILAQNILYIWNTEKYFIVLRKMQTLSELWRGICILCVCVQYICMNNTHIYSYWSRKNFWIKGILLNCMHIYYIYACVHNNEYTYNIPQYWTQWWIGMTNAALPLSPLTCFPKHGKHHNSIIISIFLFPT